MVGAEQPKSEKTLPKKNNHHRRPPITHMVNAASSIGDHVSKTIIASIPTLFTCFSGSDYIEVNLYYNTTLQKCHRFGINKSLPDYVLIYIIITDATMRS